MTANEVLTLAKAGELLQLSPAIKDSNDVLIGYLNLGMIELYKRFMLRTDEAIITLVDGKTIYKLDGTDADVAMDGSMLYLIAAYGDGTDMSDYSTDDVRLPINEEDNLLSINTVSYNEVQVPLITPGAFISLIYVVKPDKVTALTLDAELDMPDQFVEPLLHYLGYRAHGSMDGNIQTESNTHYMRFEASCNRLKELGVGITPDDISMRNRLFDKGFV